MRTDKERLQATIKFFREQAETSRKNQASSEANEYIRSAAYSEGCADTFNLVAEHLEIIFAV